MKYWLLAFSFLLLIPNFINVHLNAIPSVSPTNEEFDPVLAKRIQNLETLDFVIDSIVSAKLALKTNEKDILAKVTASVIRYRFFHGYSHYSLSENWIAAVAGKLVWYNLSAIVLPNDILKYPMAACSQQSIVLMEHFRNKKIPFRKIAFDHHFAVEGLINGQWIYFDTNLEPRFNNKRRSFEYLNQGNRLRELYKDRLPPDYIATVLGNPKYGKINAFPAPNAKILHKTLMVLSRGLWVLPLFLFGINLWSKRRKEA